MTLSSEDGTFTLDVTTGANTNYVDIYRAEGNANLIRIATNLVPVSNHAIYVDMAVANAVPYTYLVSAVNTAGAGNRANQANGNITGS